MGCGYRSHFHAVCLCVPVADAMFFQNIAATALFLANNAEENCRKTKDIIVAVAKVAQKNAKLIIDEQSKEYWRWKDSILTYEEVMLEQLTFDLMIDNPYRHLFEILGQLDIVHNKHLHTCCNACRACVISTSAMMATGLGTCNLHSICTQRPQGTLCPVGQTSRT